MAYTHSLSGLLDEQPLLYSRQSLSEHRVVIVVSGYRDVLQKRGESLEENYAMLLAEWVVTL